MFTATLKRRTSWEQPTLSERHGHMTMQTCLRYPSHKAQSAEKVLASYVKSLEASGYTVKIETTEAAYYITGQ